MTNQEYLSAVYSLGFTLWNKGGIRAVAPLESQLGNLARWGGIDSEALKKTPVADAKVEGLLTLLAERSAQTGIDNRIGHVLDVMESMVKARS